MSLDTNYNDPIKTETPSIQNSPEITIIGIHNEDPRVLYIQFSVGDRYFIYQRNTATKDEHVQELFHGTKDYKRPMSTQDERLLIGALKFMPLIRKKMAKYAQ
ncbi:MAG: hypothetical protein M0T74_00460 [Desulfitobacterium hafniense]|nr:hypothetical protein [Desulfitobacterium hafniense]